MSNPFEGQLRALGIPMLSDRPGYGMGPGRSPRPMTVDPHLSQAPGLLPDRKGWDQYPQPPPRPEPPPPKPRRRSDALRIFVSGGLDREWGHNTEDQYKQYQAQVDGPAELYRHNEIPSIMAAIRKANESGTPVDVIGHSYGGTAAFNAVNQVAQQGGHVRNLVTGDPVGRLASTEGPLPRGSVGKWVNITADPHDPNLSDWIAGVGSKAPVGADLQSFNLLDYLVALGRPTHVPTNYADQNVIVDRNHEELSGMLGDAGVPDLLKQQDDAAASRLHDGLPTPEWMRRRNAETGPIGRHR